MSGGWHCPGCGSAHAEQTVVDALCEPCVLRAEIRRLKDVLAATEAKVHLLEVAGPQPGVFRTALTSILHAKDGTRCKACGCFVTPDQIRPVTFVDRRGIIHELTPHCVHCLPEK